MTTELPHDGQHARVTVTRGVRGGWDVREVGDSGIVREVSYTDWHRVERAVQRYDVESAKHEVPATKDGVRHLPYNDPGAK